MCRSQGWFRELSASHLVCSLGSDFSAGPLPPLQTGSAFCRESEKASSHHELQPNLQTNLFEGSWPGSD